MSVIFSLSGVKVEERSKNKKTRKHKGKSLIDFPDDYIIIDIETTDFDCFYGEIIEISAKKYIDHRYENEFTTLIKAENPIDQYITELTGITNEMLENKPSFADIAENFMNFIDGYILIGHNVHFDINFLYDNLLDLGHILNNNLVDTLRLSKISVKDTKNHQLDTLCQLFNLQRPSHRASADVNATKDLYDKLIELHREQPQIMEDFFTRQKRRRKNIPVNYDNIEPTIDTKNIDPTNPFFNKYVCFTGKMEIMTKQEAAQYVVNLGGKPQTNVTQKTHYLVIGDLEYRQKIYGDKSLKHKKAEKLIAKGQDLEILTEISFLEILDRHV